MTDDVRERHEHINDHPGLCDYCDREWPCDAIQQADRADKAEEWKAFWQREWKAEKGKKDAAEAIARELAVLLRLVIEAYDEDNRRPPSFVTIDNARDELARFDAEYPDR